METATLDRNAFECALTEAAAVSPLGTTLFDSLIGLAVRRWCAPLLDLEPHATPEAYLARRAELDPVEVTLRFLGASGIAEFLLDDGVLSPTAQLPPECHTRRIIRLEQLALDVRRAGTSVAGFADAVYDELAKRAGTAVGCKSIAAYRVGLDLAAERPSDAELRNAVGDWLAGPERLAHQAIHRFLIWAGIDQRLPVQIHVGYGDSDVDLHRCDPLLLTGLLRATQPTGVPIVLLHNYPFHRHAGYLAQVFEHVFCDLSLITHNAGNRAPALLAEALEIVPFGKFLFGSDAYGLAELYYLGTLLFRRGLAEFLDDGIAEDAWSATDAERIARLISVDNARRVYRLNHQG